MARPIKQGIDYFPLDVNFLQDIKIRKIMRAQKDAVTVLVALLCNIYRDEGYYMGFDDDECFLIADEVGVSEGAVQAVVDLAIKVDFFDREKYQEFKILTSKGIQNRFFQATSRRKNIEIIDDYIINDNNNLVNVSNNSINDNKSTQSKVKESKVKESKEKNSSPVSVDNNLKRVVEVYLACGFGEINAVVADNLKDLIGQYAVEWIEDAFKISVERNKRSIAYVRGILENWKRSGRDEDNGKKSKPMNKFHNLGKNEYKSENLEEKLLQLSKRRLKNE